MTSKTISEAVSNISSRHIEEAADFKAKAKRPVWVKWGAMAACLCLMVVAAVTLLPQNNVNPIPEEDIPPVIGEGPGNVEKAPLTVFYNGMEYRICKNNNTEVLKECGLPEKIAEEHAGNFLCYLGDGQEENQLIPTEQANEALEENDIFLYEYAVQPNENIYILCMAGEYSAVIRYDDNGYHGLTD